MEGSGGGPGCQGDGIEGKAESQVAHSARGQAEGGTSVVFKGSTQTGSLGLLVTLCFRNRALSQTAGVKGGKKGHMTQRHSGSLMSGEVGRSQW